VVRIGQKLDSAYGDKVRTSSLPKRSVNTTSSNLDLDFYQTFQ
jgi:hypothetical protein